MQKGILELRFLDREEHKSDGGGGEWVSMTVIKEFHGATFLTLHKCALNLMNCSIVGHDFLLPLLQVAPRNTIGEVPLKWYEDEEHIGYDITGKKIKKQARKNKLDSFLAGADDAKNW